MDQEQRQFQRLSLNGKIGYLKDSSSWITARIHRGFEVHLYQCNGFYAELWKRMGIPEIAWIEPITDERAAEIYCTNVAVNKLIS